MRDEGTAPAHDTSRAERATTATTDGDAKRPRTVMDVLKGTVTEFNDDECSVRAAALAYYTIFALPPLLVLLLIVAGALWDPADVERVMTTQFAGLLGPDGAGQIEEMLAHADRPGSGGLVATLLGIGGLLFGATGAFVSLQDALNRAWEVAPDPKQGGIRQFVTKRFFSLGMVLGIGFLLAVSLALTSGVSAMASEIGLPVPEPLVYVIELALSFVVLGALFATMFKVVPDAEIAWRDALVGGAVTALLFTIGKFAIGLYLGRSDPGSAFGAAGALAVVLVWTYYAGMILLAGAEFTQQWTKRRGATIVPEKGAVRVEQHTVHHEAAA
jgi:membrane protein